MNIFYVGFKVRKYDNKTRFCHLFSGYIAECMNMKMNMNGNRLGLFPLKLQNLCMQYCGFNDGRNDNIINSG